MAMLQLDVACMQFASSQLGTLAAEAGLMRTITCKNIARRPAMLSCLRARTINPCTRVVRHNAVCLHALQVEQAATPAASNGLLLRLLALVAVQSCFVIEREEGTKIPVRVAAHHSAAVGCTSRTRRKQAVWQVDGGWGRLDT